MARKMTRADKARFKTLKIKYKRARRFHTDDAGRLDHIWLKESDFLNLAAPGEHGALLDRLEAGLKKWFDAVPAAFPWPAEKPERAHISQIAKKYLGEG